MWLCACSFSWLWSGSCCGTSVSAVFYNNLTENPSRLLNVCVWILQCTTSVYWGSLVELEGSVWVRPSGAMASGIVRMERMKPSVVRPWTPTVFAASTVSFFRYQISDKSGVLHSPSSGRQLYPGELLNEKKHMAASVCWWLGQRLREDSLWADGLHEVLNVLPTLPHFINVETQLSWTQSAVVLLLQWQKGKKN